MEAQQHVNEAVAQCKFCRGEGDTNIWVTRASENHDKQVQGGCPNCQVLKSGYLFISSKGIGWTSWKRRWFILTRTSLVFFRSDPNVPSQKGGEANLTLGGIDLNNSGSVVVRSDKRLLTVLFPDGRDGRAITLKAETLEDMNEWKTALENALAQAPSAALVMGQNGIFRNDAMESIEASFEQWRDKKVAKSMIIGRPILLALEEIDGSPSFLEKALIFIENYGIKVEGILRQSADVEEVEHRVQEYEKGKNEFDPNEDAHVVGDCIKHVLRELPSSPVPVACCMALLEALRSDRGSRISSMRAVVSGILPEPNRRLLQRVLRMMRIVASHRSENRMSISAVAACMAPLLLRPLLAGDCELEDGVDLGGDGSMQLLQAAAAANHAQAITIIFLEEYGKIFDDDSFSAELCSDSEDCDSDNEDVDDDDDDDDDDDNDDDDNDNDDNDDDGDESVNSKILEDEGYHDAQNELGHFIEEDSEDTHSGSLDESDSDLCGSKPAADPDASMATPKHNNNVETIPQSYPSHDSAPSPENSTIPQNDYSQECYQCIRNPLSSLQTSLSSITPSCVNTSAEKSNPLESKFRPRTVWGRTAARKNLSLESIDYSVEDDNVIQRLEITKSELEVKIAKEVQGNAALQGSIEKRKQTLHERRMALEDDVKRLQEQLRRERELRACLEAGLMNMRPGQVSLMPLLNCKDVRGDLEEIALAEADVINLKQKASDLRGLLSQRLCSTCGQQIKEKYAKPLTLTPSIPHQRTHSDGEATARCGEALEHHPVDLPEELPGSNRKPLFVRGEVEGGADEKSLPDKQKQQSNEEQVAAAWKAHLKTEISEPQDASAASTSSSSSLSSLSASTGSALLRLTHRLNFLKERRSQLATELQGIDLGPAQCLDSPPR